MSWLDLVNKDELKALPEKSVLLSDNHISMVYRGNDGWIYKRTIPYFVSNERMFLSAMYPSGLVPQCRLYDKYTLQIKDFGRSEEVFDNVTFIHSCKKFLVMLKAAGIRHGDLTKPHLIVVDNAIIVIDWAESRWMADPAPNKRQEGDRYWLDRTMREMIGVGLDDN